MQITYNPRRFLASLSIVFAMMAAVFAFTTSSATALDCGSRIGFSPGCFPQNSQVPLVGKGFMPGTHKGTYCVIPQNYQSQAINVAAKLIGHKSGPFHRVKSGGQVQLCRSMPKHGCPKINLRMRSGDVDTNLGTYPTCGASLRFPTSTRPTLRVCATNPASHAQKLELDHGSTVGMTVRAKAHERVCVTRNFAKKQRQKIRVLWNNGDFSVSLREIQLYAWMWKLGS